MDRRNEIGEFLRSRGFRLTPQREKILDIFFTLPEGEHLSAEDLQNTLRQSHSDISLATSYRTLKLLASLGVLRELDFAEDHKHYELARSETGMEHQHMICVECGQTTEFTSIDVFDAATTIARLAQFELMDAQLKLFGRCHLCQTKSL
jgi:Fur family ferric uptake transcriptional regulator